MSLIIDDLDHNTYTTYLQLKNVPSITNQTCTLSKKTYISIVKDCGYESKKYKGHRLFLKNKSKELRFLLPPLIQVQVKHLLSQLQ